MLINKLYNAPAFRLFIFFSCGIITGKEIIFNPLVVVLLIIACVLFALQNGNLPSSSLTIIFLTAAVLAGIVKSNYDFYSVREKSLLNLRYNHSGIFLRGIVSDLPETGKDKIQFKLESEYLVTPEDTIEVQGDVLVTVRQTKEISDTTAPRIPEAGDRVVLYGDLADAPEGMNPGEFDYRNYLRLNDIEKTFRVYFYDDVLTEDKNNLGFFRQNIILPARKYAIENINSYIGGNEGAFLNGLVTGYRSDIPREMKDDFVKAGVMHILAVSGLNVAYVILMLSFALSILRFGSVTKIIFYIIALVFYTYFAGATASIIRAVIMGSLLVVVPLIQRKPNYYNIIGVSAVIILAIDSRQLFNPGFILTYASVLSIIFFMDRINYSFPSLSESKKGLRLFLNRITLLVLSGLAAQAGVLPVTVYYFSKVSFSGIAANLVAIPLSNVSLALGFFQVITGIVSPYLCGLIAVTNTMLLKFQLEFIHRMAAFSYSHAEFSGITFSEIFVFYLVLLIISTAGRKRIAAAFAVSAFIIISFILISGIRENNLRITVLSIGNSDCAHIETPDGSNIIIDAGTENPYTHSCTYRVIPYLKHKRVGTIDLLFITSDIEKNYNVLKNLSGNFRISRLVYGIPGKISERTLNLFAGKSTDIMSVNDADAIKGFGNLGIDIIKNPEVNSYMIKTIYGSTAFLFAGIADSSEDKSYVVYNSFAIKSDVLKIAGHGGSRYTSDNFLAAVNPCACIISAGNYGRNTLSPQTLEKLRSRGIRVYRTDIDNALIFESDGSSITLER